MGIRQRFVEDTTGRNHNSKDESQKKHKVAQIPLIESADRNSQLRILENACAKYLSERVDGSLSNVPDKSRLLKLHSYFHRRRIKEALRKTAAVLAGLSLLCGTAWAFSYANVARAAFRIAIIQIFPYWDWTYLHTLPCFLENYSLRDQPVSDAHCAVCDDLSEVVERRKGEVTAFQVGEDYLVEDMPLIIRGAVNISTLPIPLSLDEVMDHHRNDKTLEPCKFRTNLRTKTAFNFDSFLRKIDRPDMDMPWFAFWELCKHHNVREARAVVPRPEELPLMLEIGDSIWFFTSQNYSAITFKQIEQSTPVFWLTQIAGSSRLRFVPRGVCRSVCREMEATLETGDLVLATNDIFDIGWMPSRDTEVLAIGAGAK